jgi:hypothetical protein
VKLDRSGVIAIASYYEAETEKVSVIKSLFLDMLPTA